jgi:hypothetical protein
VRKTLTFQDIELQGLPYRLLVRAKDGLSGHIGEVFPDLSDRSSWLYGTGEAWERGPYYMDGLFVLAFLVRDEALLQKAGQWYEALLSSQQEDGSFGPEKTLDWWPRMVALKALVGAYQGTHDTRILRFMKRYFVYWETELPRRPLDFWAHARGLEGFRAFDLLESEDPTATFPKLKEQLRAQTVDWSAFFKAFPYPEPTDRYLSKRLFALMKPLLQWLDKLAKQRKDLKPTPAKKVVQNNSRPLVQHYLKTHGVNLAMALKYGLYEGEDEQNLFDRLDVLLRHHGNALSLFSSDEHVNGPNADKGVELCVVVEAMYAMEEAIRLKGSAKAADYLDFYAWNALKSTITYDFTAHQYVQSPDQCDVTKRKHPYYDAGTDANLYGVAPYFGCCAANMHQGWPKYFASALYREDDTIAMYLYVEGKYRIRFEDGVVDLLVETNYPFEDKVKILVLETTRSKPTTLKLRLPYRAKTTSFVNGEVEETADAAFLSIDAVETGWKIELDFHFPVELETNPDQSIRIRRGPLLFAMPIPSEEIKYEGRIPYHDRGYVPKTPIQSHPTIDVERFRVVALWRGAIERLPDEPTVSIQVQGIGPSDEPMTLVPYGQTVLRYSHFPMKGIHDESTE